MERRPNLFDSCPLLSCILGMWRCWLENKITLRRSTPAPCARLAASWHRPARYALGAKRVVEKRMDKVCWTSDSQSLIFSGAGGAEMKSQWGRNEVAVGLPCWTGVIGAWTARVTRQHQTWARALARCCGVVGGPALHTDVGSEEEKRRFVWAKVVAGRDFRSNICIGTQTYLCGGRTALL